MREKKLSILKNIVDSAFGVDISEKCRKIKFLNARMVFSKIARDYQYKYQEVGDFLGLSHATVMNSVRLFDIYSETDKVLMKMYMECLEMFESQDSFDSLDKGDLKKQIINLKRQINSLNSELTMSKSNNQTEEVIRLFDLFNIVKDRTRIGTEDYIKQKLNTFYNGVYN
jgi:hypothetical protein